MKTHCKITLLYLILGFAWILATDYLVAAFTEDPLYLTLLQSKKGLIFVCLSALVLFFLGRREIKMAEAEERRRFEVFQSTVGGAHHILGNYLNQMNLVTLKAQRCQGFDREVLSIAKEITDDAKRELYHLGELKSINPMDIDDRVYRRILSPSGKDERVA
jgi:hypothetical protein